MYLGQLLESFASSDWGLLCNQINKKEATDRLVELTSMMPRVTYTIRNYHFEMKEVKVMKTIKADSEARSMRKDFERKLEKTRKKKAKLKEEIDALTGRSILERLMPGQRDINAVKAELSVLKEKESMLLQFLNSDIAKDKQVETSKFVNERVDTGGRTYQFNVNEWVDHSDTPESLASHANLPFLALQISSNISISDRAQRMITEAAVKIREENHTDIPHRLQRSERDTLHETSQHIGFDGYIPSEMLIMNCDYNERPNFVKKRYYFLASLLGCGAFIRNGLHRQIYEANFLIDKHVEAIESKPK